MVEGEKTRVAGGEVRFLKSASTSSEVGSSERGGRERDAEVEIPRSARPKPYGVEG